MINTQLGVYQGGKHPEVRKRKKVRIYLDAVIFFKTKHTVVAQL